MSGSSETILLTVAVIFILAGLAGTAFKAFNVEVPAITGKYARACLFSLGVVFAGAALWVILSPTVSPQSVAAPTATPTAAPAAAGPSPSGPPPTGRIGLNETVTGSLFYNEANTWVFSEGPAAVNIILDVGPFGEALLMLFDSNGVQREYVDAQTGREERLQNYFIPDDREYTIGVRNTQNTPAEYRLTLELVGGSAPPP